MLPASARSLGLPPASSGRTATASDVGGDVGVAACVGSGRNQVWAIRVGTMAEPTTTVTRIVYCVWSIWPLVRPYSAEILPKVSLVLINRVVKWPSQNAR